MDFINAEVCAGTVPRAGLIRAAARHEVVSRPDGRPHSCLLAGERPCPKFVRRRQAGQCAAHDAVAGAAVSSIDVALPAVESGAEEAGLEVGQRGVVQGAVGAGGAGGSDALVQESSVLIQIWPPDDRQIRADLQVHVFKRSHRQNESALPVSS